MTELKSASFSDKEELNIPKGAKIIKEDKTVRVEEIENGFLVSISYDVRYKMKDSKHNDYAYATIKTYSKTNPLEIKVDNKVIDTKKSLADKFA